jgi:TM2 domain-containing membrane protein YozV
MSEMIDYDSLPKSDKSWKVVFALSLVPLCSMIGVQHFYAGNPLKALIRWIPVVGWILAIVDLVKLFQGKFLDGEGNVVRK